MRLWKNAKGDLITDDQLIAVVATYGSLRKALRAGDIVLVAGDAERSEPPADGRKAVRHARLASFL